MFYATSGVILAEDLEAAQHFIVVYPYEFK